MHPRLDLYDAIRHQHVIFSCTARLSLNVPGFSIQMARCVFMNRCSQAMHVHNLQQVERYKILDRRQLNDTPVITSRSLEVSKGKANMRCSSYVSYIAQQLSILSGGLRPKGHRRNVDAKNYIETNTYTGVQECTKGVARIGLI